MGGDHFLNLQPGTIVNGRYEIVKCLGTGSMGMVYACRHRELAGHIVAMKVLFAEVARDEIAAARFRNEIVASYGVSHPNVVRAYEYFRDGDLVAFTMEYIGGGDLADRISEDELIPPDEIIGMLAQMASGVQAIHAKGIIHRDLKPENILLTAQGEVKITDFGIARTGTGPRLTEHGGVVGTIDYVSPEYLERGQVDARSDIYALGVLAYEMVTGEAPYKGKSVIETMTMRLRSDPEPPHHLRPDCPIALSNIILRAMKRDPEERYQAASEMLEDLKEIGGTAYEVSSGSHAAVSQVDSGIRSELSFTDKIDALADDGFRPDSSSAMAVNMGTAAYGAGASMSGSTLSTPTEEKGDTLELGASSAEHLRESAADDMEEFSTLGQGAGIASILDHTPSSALSGSQFDSALGVSVSSSSLSSSRIRELSDEMYPPVASLGRTILSWFAIFLIGFAVGLFLLKQFQPEFFGVSSDEAIHTE